MNKRKTEAPRSAADSYFELVTPNISGVPVKITQSPRRATLAEGDRLSRMHFHDEIEIISVESGSMIFELADGSRTKVSAGQTVCVDSRVLHSTFCGNGGVLSDKMLQFKTGLFETPDEKGYEKYIRGFAAMSDRLIMVTDDKDIFSTVEKICDEYYSEHRDGYEMYIASYIYSILGFLHRTGFLSGKAVKLDREKVERLSPVLEYVSSNYQTDITLAKASEILGVSEYYFCRLWRSALGNSFIDYLNFVRSGKAAKLLCTTGKSILDIALDTGFSSLSYFNRVFKKFRGCSPSVYRKAARQNPER